MARSDLISKLVESSLEGDDSTLRRTVQAIIAEERSRQHHVFAGRLEGLLDRQLNPKNGGSAAMAAFTNGTRLNELAYTIEPQRRFEDLILPPDALTACRELVEEQQRVDLLRSHNLQPRNRVLLCGAPGTGKTSLAEAIAEALAVPLVVVRYEGIITSYLGETAQRLKQLFDRVRSMHCVLFLDEFDAIAKERGDTHETGEIKRLVSSLLLQVDSLPSYTVLIAASNHQELLDRAVWRRFQLRLSLPMPDARSRREWAERLQRVLNRSLPLKPETIAGRLAGANFAELEEIGIHVLRRQVLAGPEADLRSIVNRTLAEWEGRAGGKTQKVKSRSTTKPREKKNG